MVSFLCAGIPLSSFDARTVMPQLLTQVARSDLRKWPASNRNGGRLRSGMTGRLQIGIGGRIEPESATSPASVARLRQSFRMFLFI
jgi:hypothetical protein